MATGERAGERTGRVFSRANTIEALLTLHQAGTLGLTRLEKKLEGWSGMARAVTTVLEDAGLVEIVVRHGAGPFGKDVNDLQLTPLGQEVAARLAEIEQLLAAAENEESR